MTNKTVNSKATRYIIIYTNIVDVMWTCTCILLSHDVFICFINKRFHQQ